mmetsp:Transcript_86194/g.258353  ORF Transcript_86194/g.258353 Transcript_86194/m.258353 type:complete len:256 (+) Transcript_86194:2840-3607(+)
MNLITCHSQASGESKEMVQRDGRRSSVHARSTRKAYSAIRRDIFETNRVANLLPQLDAHLLGHAFRDAHRSDAPWLRAPHDAKCCVAILVQVLRNLSRFPGARLAHKDDDRVVADHVEERLTAAVDGQEASLLINCLGARKLGRRFIGLLHVIGIPRFGASVVIACLFATRRTQRLHCLLGERVLLSVAPLAIVRRLLLLLDAEDIADHCACHVELVLHRLLAFAPLALVTHQLGAFLRDDRHVGCGILDRKHRL